MTSLYQLLVADRGEGIRTDDSRDSHIPVNEPEDIGQCLPLKQLMPLIVFNDTQSWLSFKGRLSR